MAKAMYQGRFQRVNLGKIWDVMTVYSLACESSALPKNLMLFKDRMHSLARERKEELEFLGNLDGIIIGIVKTDPQEVLPERGSGTESFFNVEKNSLSYFQRMFILKEMLSSVKLPFEKIDFVPKFPWTFYPGSQDLFEPNQSDLAFQYQAVEDNRDMHRVEEMSIRNNSVVLYQDVRYSYNIMIRKTRLSYDLPKITQSIFNLYVKGFNPELDGTYDEQVEKSIDMMLNESEKSSHEPVFAIECYPRQSDRDEAEKRFGKPFDKIMKYTPYEEYMMLKERLLKKGVDLGKTHITFAPPDILFGVTPSRTESYIPDSFVFFTEQLPANQVITNKNNKFSNHPRCVETRFTNI